MFELVSPETQVVIKYDITTLYYLAARNNLTGEEKDTGFEDFKKPARYLLKTLDDCMKAVMELNKDPEADLQDEGFVVVDALHRRIKIKSPAYIALHRAAGNKVFTLKRIVELFIQNTDFAKLANDFPKEARIIKYYEWQFEEVRHDIDEMIKYARALYEEYDHDRRALASAIKDSKFSWAGFAAIGNEKNVDDLMKMITPAKLESAVADYDEYAKIRKNLFGKEDGTK